MPRRRRHKKISEYHLHRVERQASLMETAIDEATLSLAAFSPHYDALIQLREDLRVATNLLNDRPADYFRHGGHMSTQEAEWHGRFVHKAPAAEADADDQNDR